MKQLRCKSVSLTPDGITPGYNWLAGAARGADIISPLILRSSVSERRHVLS
jgi:hypothetical protein